MPQTYFVTDERMLKHKNEWDENHLEAPRRLESILEILAKERILNECTVLSAPSARVEDLRLVHSQRFIDELRATSCMNLEQLEAYSATKEAIFVNQHSFECALLSAGAAVHLVERVLENPFSGSNGFAAIRPPGHHASRDTPCGFCFFNNVVICAKRARQLGLERVLIVDWDVHAGQGTQYAINEDANGIKLISIHSYQHGTFWPKLEESSVCQRKYKNTINVPLNEIGYGDAEYAAIFNCIVMPIAVEWRPQLILISCGFDAAIGDPHGQMTVSPGGFAYMTGALTSLGVPLVALLEGGYFMESLAQGVLHVLRALLQRDQLSLNLEISRPSRSLMHFIEAFIANYSSEFQIFRFWHSFLSEYRNVKELAPIQPIADEYRGKRIVPVPHPTRGMFKSQANEAIRQFRERIAKKLTDYKRPFDKILVPLSFVRKIELIALDEDQKIEIHDGLYKWLRLGSNLEKLTSTNSRNLSQKHFAKFRQIFEKFQFLLEYFSVE